MLGTVGAGTVPVRLTESRVLVPRAPGYPSFVLHGALKTGAYVDLYIHCAPRLLPLDPPDYRPKIQNTPTNPFRAAVPFWGQTTQISSGLSPKRDSGPKRANTCRHTTRYTHHTPTSVNKRPYFTMNQGIDQSRQVPTFRCLLLVTMVSARG